MWRQNKMRLNKAQATTELAIMGSIILMALLFLAQQGFFYIARQGLDMYTFRQALAMSKQTGRGISLTTVRDIISPSFFTGLKRSRIMASVSVETNPWDLWEAVSNDEEDSPQDIDTFQLIQIGEGMLQNDHFIKLPVTKVKVKTKDRDEWGYVNSIIREFDAQTPLYLLQRISNYNYNTTYSEDKNKKQLIQTLETSDQIPLVITFQNATKIAEDYKKNDWEGEIENVTVDNTTIPQNIMLTLEEIIKKERKVNTNHPN